MFAICDYYYSNNTTRNSRHIYDIYKLLRSVDINTIEMKELVKSVREVRKKNKTCISAQDGVNINSVLETIINTDFFKKDYEKITVNLLFKKVSYSESINGLKEIINSNIFCLDDEIEF